jgi:hypothetical protein
MPWALGGSSRRRMPWAAFVVAGAVALGGCTGQSEPDPSPSAGSASATSSASPPVTPSPSPSVTASGPEIPPSAREQTEAGAIAYAKFFFDQVNVAWTEPRAGLIESLSDPACKFCAFTEQKAMELVGSKLRYRKAPIEMLSVEAVVGAPQGQQYLVASLEQKRVDVVNASGVVVDSDERLVSESYVVLKWADGWMLREVEEAE